MPDERDYAGMVRELMDDEDAGMSSWELTFIEDMDGRNAFMFTRKQREKIAQIWDDRIGNK